MYYIFIQNHTELRNYTSTELMYTPADWITCSELCLDCEQSNLITMFNLLASLIHLICIINIENMLFSVLALANPIT